VKTTKKSQYKGKALEHYDRDFYEWTIDHSIGDPRDLWISDLDAMVRDRDNNFQLIEIKRNNYVPKPYQLRNMKILDEIFKYFMHHTNGEVRIQVNGRKEKHKVKYYGFNLLQLSGPSFFESTFHWNGQEISSQALKELLSFKSSNDQSYPPP